MNTKTNDFARTTVRTMLDAHLRVVDASMAQAKIAEEQTAAMFAASRRNAELQRDLLQNLSKVWIDAILPADAKPATDAK